jgi:DNA polymerase
MKRIFLDFESYYDDLYSLRKMTPAEYLLDARFEMIGCAVAVGDGPSDFMDAAHFDWFLQQHDPLDCMVISHNALFDACLLTWHYNWMPRLFVDTLAMSRALLQHKLRSLSLDSVARHLGLGVKGTQLIQMKGMTTNMIRSRGLWPGMAEYARNDNDLCRGIFKTLLKDFPAKEIVLNDMVIRCAAVPMLMFNREILHEHLADVLLKKQQLLAQCGVTDVADLMSNDKFAEVLSSLGVEPPRKVSQRTGKETWAFSKTDVAFMELEEHDDPMVQAAVAARMGFKSTIEQTRTERFIAISQLTWPSNQGHDIPWAPIPLRFSGAHTHRLSGDWKLNMQNLGRGSRLRYALEAPPGYKVMTVDASQIEARVNATLWGQEDLRLMFERGEDVYSSFAGNVFGYPVNKKTHPKERFIGKTSVLGLGFGVGHVKFFNTVRLKSKQDLGEEMILPEGEAQRIVNLFRGTYNRISAGWDILNGLIPAMAAGTATQTIGPLKFGAKAIRLPSGLDLKYHNLRYETHEVFGSGWVYDYAGKPKRLYGAALDENVVQAIARCVTMDAAVRMRPWMDANGCFFVMQVHDELVYAVPDHLVDDAGQLMLDEMRRRPTYMPMLPLDAEVGVGYSYGDAK